MFWSDAILCTIVITVLNIGLRTKAQEGPVWTYKCERNICEKLLLEDGEVPQSLNVCKIMCDANAMIWPRPRHFQASRKTLVRINPQQVTVTGVGVTGQAAYLLDKATVRFLLQLSSVANQVDVLSEKSSNSMHVDVVIRDQSVVRVELDTAEGYNLTINQTIDGEKVGAFVTADTFFGARHALETISQLFISDKVSSSLLILSNVEMFDEPVFTYRGVNLDTSRNYFSVDAIKRTIDGMAVNKLNTLHWHMTDSHSWPFVSESYPELSRYGAYSPEQVYTPADIRDLVEFGHIRGVRILPELDAPAHVGEGFQFADPGTVVCFKAKQWKKYCGEPPCGQLNPTSEQVYEILGGVYSDMLRVFESDLFHMGGDEVNINCWNTSTAVTDKMADLGIPRTEEGFLDLWQSFQTRAYQKLVQANGRKKLSAILWNNGLTKRGEVNKYLDKDTYIIEIWTKGNDTLMAELVNNGFRVIIANHDVLYLDRGFGSWMNGRFKWWAPFSTWDEVYDNDIYKLLTEKNVTLETAKNLTLGAEVNVWSEQADESNLDNMLWPRAAALAERLWTNPKEGWRSAEARMLFNRQRLQGHGLNPNRLQPEWCIQNEGYCPYVKEDYIEDESVQWV